jgi:hypothetical protein
MIRLPTCRQLSVYCTALDDGTHTAVGRIANSWPLVKVQAKFRDNRWKNVRQQGLGDSDRLFGISCRHVCGLVDNSIPLLLELVHFLPQSLRSRRPSVELKIHSSVDCQNT